MRSKAKGYEGSKWDKDRGVKEGSKADMKRDVAGKAKYRAAMKKGKR